MSGKGTELAFLRISLNRALISHLREKGLGEATLPRLVAGVPRLHLEHAEGSVHEGSDAASVVRVNDAEPRERIATKARNTAKVRVKAALDVGDGASRPMHGLHGQDCTVKREGGQPAVVVVSQVEPVLLLVLVGRGQLNPRVSPGPILLHLEGAESPGGHPARRLHQRGLEEVEQEVEVGIDP